MKAAQPSSTGAGEAIFSNPLLKGYPWAFRLHVAVCFVLGTVLALSPATLLSSPPWTALSDFCGFPRASVSPDDYKLWSSIGILIAGFGCTYIICLGEVNDESMRLARSMTKGRITVASIAAVMVCLVPECRDLLKAAMVVEDGLMAIFTGYQMGVF